MLEELYRRCHGYAQRMQELLQQEYGIDIGYSTLTRRIRRLQLRDADKPQRAAHVPDTPGQEMQHDTSAYSIALGDQLPVKLICSILYLRYSKMRYVKFYRSFNRFRMKCFLYEALTFFRHCARNCIIDNTSLVVIGGTGSEALFAPEMVAFANAYGFSWTAHALRHPNRKAGNERSFWTVETSFLPGRRFTSLEDLNAQALQWAGVTFAQRPQSHTGLIPAVLFEHEQSFLQALPTHISPPSQPHHRTVDPYGYIRFEHNFYWVPDGVKDVTVIEYAQRIAIYATPGKELISYPLPPAGTHKQVFAPPEATRTGHQPRNLKLGCDNQETLLRAKGTDVGRYLDFIHSPQCILRYKPRFVRRLYELSRSCDQPLFVALIERALEYRVSSFEALLRIAVQIGNAADPAFPQQPLSPSTSQDYHQRPQYRLGEFSCEYPTDPAIFDTPPKPEENADGSETP